MTTYTLFGQSGGGTVTTDPSAVNLGMQFSLSQAASLTGIWFWSPPGAGVLPDACVIYQVSGTSQVAGTLKNSPSWSGAAGAGWVKVTYDGSVTLSAGVNYKVVIHHSSGSDFYGGTAHYWDSGPGAGGLTSGIIAAPNNGGGDGGQDTFTPSSSVAYPSSNFNSANYWVDVEVATGTAHTATAALTVTPSSSAARTHGHARTGSLTVTPSFSAARTRGHFRTAAFTAAPLFSAARTRGHSRTGALTVTPSLSAVRTAAHVRHPALTVTPVLAATGHHAGTANPVLFAFGDPRWAWTFGAARNE